MGIIGGILGFFVGGRITIWLFDKGYPPIWEFNFWDGEVVEATLYALMIIAPVCISIIAGSVAGSLIGRIFSLGFKALIAEAKNKSD